MIDFSKPRFTATYTNWRGETRERHLVAITLWYGSTNYHPEPQWLLRCMDLEKYEIRDMALAGFTPPENP
jgi:hypothetical protein